MKIIIHCACYTGKNKQLTNDNKISYCGMKAVFVFYLFFSHFSKTFLKEYHAHNLVETIFYPCRVLICALGWERNWVFIMMRVVVEFWNIIKYAEELGISDNFWKIYSEIKIKNRLNKVWVFSFSSFERFILK